MLTYEKYLEGIKKVMLAFGADFSEDRILFFYEDLKNMKEKVFVNAVTNLIRTESFIPKNVNLVSAIRSNITRNGIY